MKEIYNLLKYGIGSNVYKFTAKPVQNRVETSVEYGSGTKRSAAFNVYIQTSRQLSQNFIGAHIFFEIRERCI